MVAKMFVNLNNIKHNLNEIKKIINNDTKIIAMVKADAYGLGDVNVCKFLETQNINFFGTAIVDEAVHLRKNNIKSDILVTGQFLKEDISKIIRYDLIVTVSNIDLLNKLNNKAIQIGKKVKVHIKVDTGMTRLRI
ncbi:MAG: alanine racemase [Clostridia bacterium]